MPATLPRLLVLGLLGLTASGCSIRGLAVNALAKSLAASGDVFASDEDPELVRDALPFALKTMETLLAEKPDNPGLLLSACQGFTQYAYAFVLVDAEALEDEDYAAAVAGYDRALKMFLRGRDYCLRAMELRSPGVQRRLEVEPESALATFELRDVPLLFWTGASWGSAISTGKDRPEITVDLDAVRFLVRRTLALDESYDDGSVHEVMMALESLPATMGGSVERAREHFERAVELSKGQRVSPFVSWAESVSVAAQDRAEFESMLERALAINPDDHPSWRLANLIAQRRARRLLDRIDDLFL
jgi:predicted anti-sigma-YlaC factor YlaD